MSEVSLEPSWVKLLIAAFARGCTLEPSTDRWGDENYGWQLNFPDGNEIFWMDVNAEPGLQHAMPMPMYDYNAAKEICMFLHISDDWLYNDN